MTTGYSGTPLAKKIGIKTGFVVQVLYSPKPYLEFFEEFPENVNLELEAEYSDPADLIHVFVRSMEELERGFSIAKNTLKKNGGLWVSWPKKSSSISTEVDKYLIMNFGLAAGLVDVKVAAIDENWSGLKFMYRTKDR